MDIQIATNQDAWDTFLQKQRFSPFLQSWTMGEVYASIGQQPLRLEIKESGTLVGICQGIIVPARRGRHIAVQYGPVLSESISDPSAAMFAIIEELKHHAKKANCHFVRMSPFLPTAIEPIAAPWVESPLHLLAEHIWHLPLTTENIWSEDTTVDIQTTIPRAEEEIFMSLRKTTRNLIRRAEKEGVSIVRSKNPSADISHFIALHEETRKRHHFTPYTNAFFRAQLEQFAARNECTLYLAYYNNEVIASSMHMHMGRETSYHHGASTHKYDKIPASYLLQWTAIQDALTRGDAMYNFWGIAPGTFDEKGKYHLADEKHPFAGVTTFKTGFGGNILELMHCKDIPVSPLYHVTRSFETIRKWRRGF